MSEDLSLEDFKNVVKKFGFSVSEIEPKGPVHMLFLEQFDKILSFSKDGPDEDITYKHKFEKYIIEYRTMIVKDIEEFENNIKLIYEDLLYDKGDTKTPICSFYTLNKVDNVYRIRLAWLDYFYGNMKEISKDRAKEILSKRESSKYEVSFEFYEDLKIVYDLDNEKKSD